MLLIEGGRVVDPASGTDRIADVLLDGDRIAAIGTHLEAPEAERLDARGLVVAPGFIDLHCHLREPGDESSETIASGTRAAVRGGFTAVCAMPNTNPVNDHPAVTRAILDRARAVGLARVWPIGAASRGSRGEELAEIAAMREAGIVAVSDDGRPIATARLLRQVMEYCRELNLPVIDHCEDSSLVAGAVVREGLPALRLGLPGMPAATESIAVARDLQIAELTGARLHIAHLSTRTSLELVREAKRRGLPVSCEVTPHHFTLTHEAVGYDTRCKVNPPLGTEEDRQALLEGLADGTVDAIATDHAPHEPAKKEVEFERAPFGMIGFETALGLALEQLYHSGRVSLMRLVELFTTGPARVLGCQRSLRVGAPADLTLFSLDRPWVYRVAQSASRSRNTPFDGRRFCGGPVVTIVGGRIVWRAESD